MHSCYIKHSFREVEIIENVIINTIDNILNNGMINPQLNNEILIKRDGGTGPVKSRQKALYEYCANSSERKIVREIRRDPCSLFMYKTLLIY